MSPRRRIGRNIFGKTSSAALALLFCASAFGAPRAWQDPDFPEVTFQEWLEQGPREELRWRQHIVPAELSFHERLMARIVVEIDGAELLKHCCEGQAVALVQITDSAGRTYRNHVLHQLDNAKPGMRQYTLTFTWNVFVLPGEYRVAVAFYYTGKPEHNLALGNLHVRPLKNDPLPGAWSELPNVEFTDAQPEGLDEFFLPGITGRLHLPVVTRRAVQLEVLENLTPYRSEQKHTVRFKARLASLLPILKTFSQLELQNGSLRLATMDFTRNRVTFEQDEVSDRSVNWKELRDALSANDPGKIDVHDLRDTNQYAAFFREEMSRRLSLVADREAKSNQRALRVIVVVSSPIQFGFGRPKPVPPPQNSDFVVYYVRCEFLPRLDEIRRAAHTPPEGIEGAANIEEVDDGIGKVLRSLKPRIFVVHSSEDLRKSLATMIGELSRM
jgi:hypothetical protein